MGVPLFTYRLQMRGDSFTFSDAVNLLDYLDDLGWTMLDGERVEAPWGGLLLGVNDPRSSGLGNWRDETGLSFAEVTERVADTACEANEAGERISTLLVTRRETAEPTD